MVRARPVSQSAVISLRMTPTCSSRSRGSTSARWSAWSASPTRRSLASTVRRLASVGCAVSTSSTVSRSSKRAHRRVVHAARLEPAHRVGHALGRGCWMLRALPLAERGHALRLLGQVDEVEVEREGGGHAPRGRRRQRRHLGGEPLRRARRARPPVLGLRADALLHLEQRGALLLGDHLAEQRAEEMDTGREVHADACRSSTLCLHSVAVVLTEWRLTIDGHCRLPWHVACCQRAGGSVRHRPRRRPWAS